jgi:hypothetical protein
MVVLEALPSLGALEELEAFDVGDLPVSVLCEVLVGARLVMGRAAAVEARALAQFDRLGGPAAGGAASAEAWLASRARTSHVDAKRAMLRATAVAALPELGVLLAAGAISGAHVEVIAGVVPAKLLASAGELVEAAQLVSPERLRYKALRFVMRADGDDGASRSQRQREAQKLSFFPTDAGIGAM